MKCFSMPRFCRPHHCTMAVAALFLALTGSVPTATAQDALKNGAVEPMGEWVEQLQVTFTGQPLLVHLRTGYERAVVMPEPIDLSDNQSPLPGAEVLIEARVVGFYPTKSFKGQLLKVVGRHSGTVYNLWVSSSTKGVRQPIRINR